MYFRARYYDPQLGEFISRDPLGYVDGMSLYRGYFVPTNADPFGKFLVLTGEDDDRYFWTRDQWKAWADKGNRVPGHWWEDWPGDYSGPLPNDTAPEPIDWGENVFGGLNGLAQALADRDNEDRRNPGHNGCKCYERWNNRSRGRPPGVDGKYATPGTFYVDCGKEGNIAVRKYQGKCVTLSFKFDQRCPGRSCQKKSCWIYRGFICKHSRNRKTGEVKKSWVGLDTHPRFPSRDRLSDVRTNCAK